MEGLSAAPQNDILVVVIYNGCAYFIWGKTNPKNRSKILDFDIIIIVVVVVGKLWNFIATKEDSHKKWEYKTQTPTLKPYYKATEKHKSNKNKFKIKGHSLL